MKHYCLNCGIELADKQYICPQCHHNVYLDSLDEKTVAKSFGVLSAINIEANSQWCRYRCGKNGSAGFGFAAEDINNINDILNGSEVDSSGRNNERNGPDRIVNGENIQTKYYATPKKTINSAFENNGSGKYRYQSEKWGVQTLEVPSEHHSECIDLMKEKIMNGQVEGVTDPKQAEQIVRKGCSYKQARNVARAGNCDSLVFDAKTGCITALSSLGVAFCIKLCMTAINCRDMEDFKTAVQLSFLDGLKNGTITLTTHIASTQIIRTVFGRNFAAMMNKMCKGSIESLYQYQFGKDIVHRAASNMWNKTLTGISAKGTIVKVVRLNAITSTFVFVASSIPDIYRFLSKDISGKQFIKNLTVNLTSVTGATIGSFIGLYFKAPMIGGMIGGVLGGILSKQIADKISPDDTNAMQELIKIAMIELSNEYCIQSQEEFQNVVRIISNEQIITSTLLRAMYSAGADNDDDMIRVELAKQVLEYPFNIGIRQRPKIKMIGKDQFLIDCIDNIQVDE